MIQEQIHQRALEVSQKLKTTEKELQEVLREVEKHKVYLHYGHASLFKYAVDALGLTPDVAYNHISVARASVKIPELKKAIDRQEISVSQARHLTSILTKENQVQLVEFAKHSTQQELKKEIARIAPEKSESRRDQARYINDVELKLGVVVSETLMKKIKRAQDLVSQSKRGPVGLEETLEAMVEAFLDKKDPLRKAERAKVKQESKEAELPLNAAAPKTCIIQVESENEDQERKPIPAQSKHPVMIRDQGQCTETLPNGKRCPQTRWLHIHHVKPVSEGGTNNTENLKLLCSGHHRSHHYREGKGLLM